MIRLLLVAGATGVLVAFLSSSASARLRAGRRLVFVGITVLFAAAALQPQRVDDLAQLVGVGRGADLVLYLLATAFLYLVLYVYQEFREQQRRLAVLVRHLALLEARLAQAEESRTET